MTTSGKTARGSLVGFRLALRLARRDTFRRPGRTILVALLVALPVASMTVAVVMVRTQHETPHQLWQQQYGNADAALYTNASGHTPNLAQLPASTIANGPLGVEDRLLRTIDSHRSTAMISVFDMTDPIGRGIVQVMSGRAPTKANEIFLTRDAARQLRVKAGDTLRLVRPARRSFEVAGVGELASGWGGAQMVLSPATPYPWKTPVGFPGASSRLIKFAAPPSATELHRLLASPLAGRAGLQISPALIPSQFNSNPGDTSKKVAWSWVIGALVLTVVGIVIAAAFAVGARRQLVTLGQLAGNGAAPGVLRRVLFLQGTLTGVIGSVAGVGLGALALALLAPHADQIFRRDVHPYIVRPLDVVPILLLGIVTATVAALVPARAASRVPVLAALAGRRPLGRVPRWLPVAGAFVAAGGLALLGLAVFGTRGSNGRSTVWILTAMLGSVSVLLGACAIAPSYVSVLEPAAARSRGSWRVATRSLARQRTRTSAVVSAIAATGAFAIAVSSLFLSAHYNRDNPEGAVRPDEVQLSGMGTSLGNGPPPARFVADVAKVLPHSTRFQLRIPYRPNTSWSFTRFVPDHSTGKSTLALFGAGAYFTVGIADRAAIAAYGLSNADQQELAKHGSLVLTRLHGHATLSLATHVAPKVVAPRPRTLDATTVDGRKYRIGTLPSVLVTAATAEKLGMTIRPSTLVLRSSHALTTDQRNTIADIATEARDAVPATNNGAEASFNYQLYYPPTGIDPLLLEWLLVGVALVLTLFVVAVNLALSAAETRDERDVLTIVGAAPGMMSRTNGYKAALLTVMGSLLAIPVGLLPVVVFLKAYGTSAPFIVPGAVIALLVVAVPIAAGLVTGAASALALRVRPVHISTMAYD